MATEEPMVRVTHTKCEQCGVEWPSLYRNPHFGGEPIYTAGRVRQLAALKPVHWLYPLANRMGNASAPIDADMDGYVLCGGRVSFATEPVQ